MSGSVFIFNHDLKAALKKEEDEQRDDSSMVIHVDHSFRNNMWQNYTQKA